MNRSTSTRDDPGDAATFVELLARRADLEPARRAYTFLADGEHEADHLTYGELAARARAIAALLAPAAGPAPRVLLLYPPGLDFIAAFFGCLWGGAVAVPAYPPRQSRGVDRLLSLVGDARPAAVLTTADLLARLGGAIERLPELRRLRWLATDAAGAATDGGAGEPAARRAPAPDPDGLALLQYTSGSTGAPRGVMVRHRNLIANSAAIRAAFDQTAASIVVGWLPLYHDMGLIGNVLQPLYAGCRCILMAPMAFLQRPARWLRAISRYRATTSGGPDFAYALCVRKLTAADLAGLDLGSWSVAFNGAEPVRAATLEGFAALLAPCGFQRAAFVPCYGLAESTLLVTAARRTGAAPEPLVVAAAALECQQLRAAAGGEPARRFVGCGEIAAGARLEVVDPDTLQPAPLDRVGEIWVDGSSVAAGYWGRSAETAETFGARLASGEGPYLRTGDLGFLRGGQLYLAGRRKDLIIVRGRNHYPQDIEATAERSHAAIWPGGCAAFAVELGGEERLVVACEVAPRARAEAQAAAAAVRQAVGAEHEVPVHEVVVLPAGSLPKTSSGKIRRGACRAGYLGGDWQPLGRSAAWTAAEGGGDRVPTATPPTAAALLALPAAAAAGAAVDYLAAVLARLQRLDPEGLGPQSALSALGLDSLAAVELRNRIAADLGIELPLALLLAETTLEQLGREILALLPGAAVSPAPVRTRTPVPAPEPLGQEFLVRLPEGTASPEPPRAPAAAGGEPAAWAPAAAEQGAAAAAATEAPLWFGQRALWFLDQLAPGNRASVLAFAAAVEPAPDVAALRRAVARLACRHAALRTTFVARHGEPVQRIHARPAVPFALIDAACGGDHEIEALLAAAARRPFALERDAPLRVLVLAGAAGRHWLLLVAHHIAVDFWSFALLLDDLASLYAAERQGGALPSAPTGDAADRMPAAVASWQEARLAGVRGEQLWRYWRQELRGGIPVLALPVDRQRSGRVSQRGGTRWLTLDSRLTARVKGLASAQHATLYTTLLAAFQVLLHRYSGQPEVVVASPASGRTAAWLEGVAGYLMNPLPLRAEMADDPPFGALLAQVRSTVLGALEHQDLPSHLLAEWLRPELGGHPGLYQAIFVLNRHQRGDGEALARFALGRPGARLRLASLSLTAVALPPAEVPCDLMLTVAEADGELHGALRYSSELFDPATAARLLGHLETLLDSLSRQPMRRLSEQALLTAGERAQLLREWADTTSPAPTALVLDLFQQHAERSPHAVALAWGDVQVSYGHLAGEVAHLAGELRAAGAGPETVVAVLLERSPRLITALLAVLAAGGAYLALDPAYPAQRLALMLADSRTPLVLTESGLADRLAGGAAARGAAGPRVLMLDRRGPAPRQGPAAAGGWRRALSPDLLAYLIYTSGSTGRPKAVMVRQGALAGYVASLAAHCGVAGHDRVLQFCSLSFDTSAEEIFLALTRGAALVLRDAETLSSPAAFFARCGRWQVTLASLPTAYWHELAAALAGFTATGTAALALPPALRLVIVGGERALARRAASWRRCAAAGARLVNTYGPTEATIAATLCDVADADARSAMADPSLAGDPDDRDPPIGRPLANRRVHLLDRRLELVPVGVRGQIAIGGAGLARGYLGDARLTAERFLPDPSSAAPGARLYLTGDLGCHRTDGRLDCLGRIDDQVKVRGFRVELHEVAAALAEHPAVREAAVVAVPVAGGAGGEPGAALRLVAYVAPRPGPAPAAGELRDVLAARLPEFMVPASFVFLPSLPHTPSGKVDRRALPPPGPPPASSRGDFVAPRGAVAEVVAGICERVLGVERIGAGDNLFELGCHSLLATQIVARLREALQVEIPLGDLFERPTVAELAAAIEGYQAEQQLPPLRPLPRDRPLPLSFAQERLWFLGHLNPGSASYHVPRALRLRGALRPAVLQAAFSALLARHEILRTSFPTLAGAPVQSIHAPYPVALPIVDLASLAGTGAARGGSAPALAEAERWIRGEGTRAFDLAAGPLFRVTLFRLAEEDHVLLLVEHHLVHDGWTEGVLLGDFQHLYAAAARGLPAALPELPIQFADFAGWQRQVLASGLLAPQLAYWQRQLAGAPELLSLPADRPRPALPSFRGISHQVTLESGLAAALRQFSRRRGATLFMTLLGIFDTLLWRYSGQTDLVVGTGVANRRRQEIEGMLGMVINTVALRADLAGDPAFDLLLPRVRRVCLEAYANQDLPFDRVVEALNPRRSSSYPPIYQVMFSFHDAPHPDLDLFGLAVEPLDAHNRSAKFDLVMRAMPHSEQGIGLRPRDDASDILIAVEHSTDLFDSTTALRLWQHVVTLLGGALAEPALRLSCLPLLGEGERHQLLLAANDSHRPRAAESAPPPLAERIAAVARSRPEAVAVREIGAAGPATAPAAGARTLTYSELARRVEALAHRLRARGVTAEVPVAICMERRSELVIAVLATLRAGGVCVPLDPQDPPQRRALILADARPAVVLASRRAWPATAAAPAVTAVPAAVPRLVYVEEEETAEAPAAPAVPAPGGRRGDGMADAAASPAAVVAGANLAFVIYTSGTTGRPKGVMVTHAGLTSYLHWIGALLAAAGAATVPFTSRIAFDASFKQLFVPLLAGGEVWVVDEATLAEVAALLRVLDARPGLGFNCAPALWQTLIAAVEAGEATPPQGLRCLLLGGERLAPELVERTFRLLPRLAVYNLYGPTEATANASWAAITAAAHGADPRITLGRPIDGARLYVLDQQLEPLPLGVPGDLWIGGPGVTRGYRGQPELTAGSFLPDPWSAAPGSRLYGSGDRARRLADGRLEFLGRADQQVKVRGFRVELGEIEAALRRHPAVRSAAVLEIPSAGGSRLVAYAAVGAELAPAAAERQPEDASAADAPPAGATARELRAFLEASLPDHMLPAEIVLLDTLPLLANGKLDRRALPPAGASPAAAAARRGGSAAPGTPTEETVAGIWRALLGREAIGRHDSFFELGGHSLLATQALSRLRHRFQVEIPLRSLFDTPTVAEIARLIDDQELRRADAATLDALLDGLDTLSDDQVRDLLATAPH